MTNEEIKLHLPKYLSVDSTNALLDALKQFPEISPDKFYTSQLFHTKVVYQGDGLIGMIFINLPDTETKTREGMVLSNTCDIASENTRLFESRIMYAPIIKLEKYCQVLQTEGIDANKLNSHLVSIRKQQITQIFYLPGIQGIIDESIVFLDRILNVKTDYVSVHDLNKRRIFTLSNYGHYILLFKLSFHFCRFQDKVDRDLLQN